MRLRPSRPGDLAFVTGLERHPDNVDWIGQWRDAEHLAAIAREGGREHWIIERDGRPAGYLIAYDRREAEGFVYVKRILVADKERGTGKAALAAYLDDVFARPGTRFAFLIVFERNARAQKVYRDLGFRHIDPSEEEARRLDAGGEPPMEECFRMRIDADGWVGRRRP